MTHSMGYIAITRPKRGGEIHSEPQFGPLQCDLISSSSSKFYFQQNTTMEQYQEKENTL